MNITFKFIKDKTNVEEGIAYIRAVLMQRYIENLNVDEVNKSKIKENLIKELQKKVVL